ncbi:MAG: CDP-6-deoxy-delta-3,4-glucoseen reductase [Rhodocyclaceae bacterium]|nr:CDP-6-deoxy-delta-3,4-glucoseen reductase [Rhodocyclaceae bacterium]
MPHSVLIQPGGQHFELADDTTILAGALDAGLTLPYGCRDGACGSCKGRVLAGEVDHGRASITALSEDERAAGMALFCCATARSDVTIECHQVVSADDFPVKKLPCRVQRMEKLADDVMLIEVKLPATEQFRFRAGQYIDFLLAGNRRRSFSIANAPQDATHLELHIRRVPDGTFTRHVFETMKEKEILRFEGPLGSFYLREAPDRPIILLAGGTGFAPIKGLVEYALKVGIERPMTLYWGSRNKAGLYMDQLARNWESEMPGFRYVPVLSDEAWGERTGLVHQAVMDDHPDLSGHQVYACGAPAMIDAARRDFASCGLPDDQFFADAFTYASDPAP